MSMLKINGVSQIEKIVASDRLKTINRTGNPLRTRTANLATYLKTHYPKHCTQDLLKKASEISIGIA